MDRRVAHAAMLAVLATAGVVAAEPATGVFRFPGPVELDAHVELRLADAAAFLRDTAQLEDLKLEASRLEVHRFRTRTVEAPLGATNLGVQIEREEARYHLTDVTLTLAEGIHDGWLGIYPAEIALQAPGGARIEARGAGRIGNTPNTQGEPDPRLPAFAHAPDGPYVATDLAGRIGARGDLVLKFQGLDVVFDAAENRTIVRTGLARGDDPAARQRDETWLFLRASDADLSIGDSALTAAGARADIRWDGTLRSAHGSGHLLSEDAAYTPDDTIEIVGRFEGALLPETTGEVRLGLELQGDLERTSLSAVRAPDAAGRVAGAVAWPLGVLALGAIGWVVVARALDARTTLSLEELVESGRLAAEAGRHGEAHEWFARARRLAPRSADLAAETAYCLGEMGRIEDALAAYAEAAALSDDGQADLDAARLLARAGAPIGEIEPFVARALDRSPALAVEVEDAPFPRSEAIDRALSRAFERT